MSFWWLFWIKKNDEWKRRWRAEKVNFLSIAPLKFCAHINFTSKLHPPMGIERAPTLEVHDTRPVRDDVWGRSNVLSASSLSPTDQLTPSSLKTHHLPSPHLVVPSSVHSSVFWSCQIQWWCLNFRECESTSIEPSLFKSYPNCPRYHSVPPEHGLQKGHAFIKWLMRTRCLSRHEQLGMESFSMLLKRCLWELT